MGVLGSAMLGSWAAGATPRASFGPCRASDEDGGLDQAAVKPCNPWQPEPAYDGPISRPQRASDLYRNVAALDPASARLALQPSVEAAHRDADSPAQHLDRETGALGDDEAV